MASVLNHGALKIQGPPFRHFFFNSAHSSMVSCEELIITCDEGLAHVHDSQPGFQYLEVHVGMGHEAFQKCLAFKGGSNLASIDR